jgi:hypothetical protein
MPASGGGQPDDQCDIQGRRHRGKTLSKFFCAKCGTPVYGQSSARTHFASIRLGFLDVGHGLRPDTSIWLSEAPEWATIDPALPQYPQQAPVPVVPED